MSIIENLAGSGNGPFIYCRADEWEWWEKGYCRIGGSTGCESQVTGTSGGQV